MLENRAQCSAATLNQSHYKDERFVAAYFGVSLATVRRWRYLGQGPRYRKIGSLVRYSVDDLSAWLASRPTGGEGTPEAGGE